MSANEFVRWMRSFCGAYSYVTDDRETFGPAATERIRETLAEVDEVEPSETDESAR